MITLPCTPRQFLDEAIVPALALLPNKLDSRAARLQLMATALQESGLRHRWQVIDPRVPETKGPARGLLQFERGGGVRGVMRHPTTMHLASDVCRMREVPFDDRAIWARLETDDILAAAFGRLLLLADPSPIPDIGEVDDAWQCYVRCWRPGRPHPEVWPTNYAAALADLP